MKCAHCKKPFQDGEPVLPVLRYVKSEKRGDFVGSQPIAYIHTSHLLMLKATSARS